MKKATSLCLMREVLLFHPRPPSLREGGAIEKQQQISGLPRPPRATQIVTGVVRSSVSVELKLHPPRSTPSAPDPQQDLQQHGHVRRLEPIGLIVNNR
jgi:hypothetical protein